MKIRIKPLDLLFFRDAKPFVQGQDVYADSLMFPNLSTIYGALRSSYFAEHPEKLKYAQTDRDPTKDLLLNQVCFISGNEIFFAKPMDLMAKRNMNEEELQKIHNENKYDMIKLKCKNMGENCNSIMQREKIQYYYTAKQQVEDIPEGVVTADELLNYSCGTQEITASSLTHFVNREDRIGIAMNDNTHSVQNNMLYSINQVRYNDLELMIDFDHLKLPEQGFLKLGGQGNAVVYQPYEGELLKNKSCEEIVQYVKLYLTSPAIFSGGWIPDFIVGDRMSGVFMDHSVQLIAACVGNAVSIAGYDMKLHREKPIKRAVPAGSIYLLKVENGFKMDQCMMEVELDSELKMQGYGHALMIKDDIE